MVQISTGDMLRAADQERRTARASKPKHIMDAGKLVPDDLMIR